MTPALDIQEIVSGVGTTFTGPLSSLEPNNTGTLFRYPSDLGTDSKINAKNHWVTFDIYDVQPASTEPQQDIRLNAGVGTTAGYAAAAVLLGVAAGAASGTSKAAAAANALVGALPGAIIGGILTYESGLKITPPVVKTAASISLYMPDTLAATYGASYEEMNLTSDLGPVTATLRSIDSSVENIGSEIMSVFKTGKGTGNDNSTSAGFIAAATNLGTIGGVNVGNIATLMLKAQGLSINPQLQMIYRGTGLREFQLTFSFTPKSADEAQTVNSIINQFRFYAAPTLASNNGSNNGATSMYLIPPALFQPKFYVNGSLSTVLPSYGKCILTNMNVDDAPYGFAAYDDGSMVQRTLILDFKELDILTRDYFLGNIGTDLRR